MVPPRRVKVGSFKGRRPWNIARTRLNQYTRCAEKNLALVVGDFIGINIPQNHQPPRGVFPPETLLYLCSECHFLTQPIPVCHGTLVRLDLLVRRHQLGPFRVWRKGVAV